MLKITLARRLAGATIYGLCHGHGISTIRKALSRLAPNFNAILSRERNHTTDPKHHPHEENQMGNTRRIIYRNKHGEEIVFRSFNPPPGYVFVPSGNVFVTRRCRKYKQKIYSVYRPNSREKLAAQIGLYVPQEVFKEVESEFLARRAMVEEKLSQAIDTKYPRIPPSDKAIIHALISSRRSYCTGNSALDHSGTTILSYVRDRYTPFKSLTARASGGWNSNAIAEAHQRADRILATWRGDDLNRKDKAE